MRSVTLTKQRHNLLPQNWKLNIWPQKQNHLALYKIGSLITEPRDTYKAIPKGYAWTDEIKWYKLMFHCLN